MLTAILTSFLAERRPEDRPSRWLVVALAYAALPPVLSIIQALGDPTLVQDDARQFVFWMVRWQNGAFFTNDLIASYFEAASPWGFKAVYWPFVRLGASPFTVGIWLTLPLSLAAGYFAYRLAMKLTPRPAAGLLGSSLTIFFLWLIDQSVSTALPRSFAVPAFLAFVVFLIERRTVAAAAAAVVLAGTYPQMALVAAGLAALSLIGWQGGRPTIDHPARDGKTAFVASIAIVLALLPFVFSAGPFGPTITLDAARTMANFQPGGRSAFLYADPIRFYVCASRSGLLPIEWGCGEAFRKAPEIAPFLGIGLTLLVALVAAWLMRRRLAVRESRIVAKAFLSAFVLFALAHAALFALHLPSRYTQHSLRALFFVAAGAVVASGLVALWRRLDRSSGRTQQILAGAVVLLGTAFLLLPLVLPVIPNSGFVAAKETALYRHLRTLPKDIVVATLVSEADNIPSRVRRTTLTAREYMIPYSRGYAGPLEARTRMLIEARFAREPRPIRRLIGAHRVTHFILEAPPTNREAWAGRWWAKMFPQAAKKALEQATSGTTPLLDRLVARCGTLAGQRYRVLSATCVAQALRPR